jgi:methylisocitrate lyase
MNDHPSQRLREAMSRGTVACPGAFTALVGRAVARAGFESVYISGGAMANTAGVPDIGLLTLEEVCRTIREVAEASGLPVMADADTGYGEAEMVARTVAEYERHGAAGLHIEDQIFPKRCGHLDGKELVSTAHMVEKIQAASASKSNNNFIVCARTDACSVEGLSSAIERGNAYREAGADMIFPEGLHDTSEFATFSTECPGLLLANMTEFGKTPMLHIDQFSDLGYNLVIYPLTMQRVAMGAVMKALSSLRSGGSAQGLVDSMQTRAELYDLLEYTPGEPWSPKKP